MPLVLAPSFDEHTRDQIEQHVALVQAQRMVAAMEYHAGKNAKLSHESDKIQARVAKQYDLLKKDLDRLEKSEAAVSNRLAVLQDLKNEIGLITDLIELHPVETEMEE